MLLLDGKKARDFYTERLTAKMRGLAFSPCLAIIQVGDDESSTAYIKQKRIFGEKIGAKIDLIKFPKNISFDELKKKIGELNKDKNVHGIIVQLPLPPHLDKISVINLISNVKDVDGLTPNTKFIPATARGVYALLNFYKIKVKGKKMAMLGRSMLVGAPTARLLGEEGALVTICHSQTANTREITKNADIIIVAIGKPKLIDETYVSKGQVVVDVGINSIWGEKFDEEISGKKLVGDVNFEKVSPLVLAISPVPGGVGPMTVLSLFENLADAVEKT